MSACEREREKDKVSLYNFVGKVVLPGCLRLIFFFNFTIFFLFFILRVVLKEKTLGKINF